MNAPSTDFSTAAPQPNGRWDKSAAPDAILSAAIGYARKGWAIIPINSLTKIPLVEDWRNVWSKDEDQVRAWWQHWPNAMVGVVTGSASGVWVLDIDLDEEKGIDGGPVLERWQKEHGYLPATPSALTPRGGRHLWFAWTEGVRNNAGRKEMRGVDWRGEGGFIVAAPSSRSDGKQYRWEGFTDDEPPSIAPQWLLDIVLKKPSISERAQSAVVQPSSYSGGRGYGAAALEAECHELATCGSGARNHQLNKAAFSLAQLVAGGELSENEVKSRLVEAAGACGLIKDDGRPSVDKTLWSGFNAGLGHPRGAPERAQDGSAGSDASDRQSPAAAGKASTAPPPAIKATPFKWRDPATMPRRQWLYGYHHIRKFISALVAPTGIGKSSLAIAEALSMATGRDLLGVTPRERCRVWLWNGEDPAEEIERRILATMLHYEIPPTEVEGWLFMDSGRDMPIKLATMDRTGVRIADPVVDGVVATMLAHQIDVLIVDPFVSAHSVTENDNMAIDAVAKKFNDIAERTNGAIGLVHHSRKTNGAEVTTEDSRGAVALMSAARVGRALNVMSEEESQRADVEERFHYFRADTGKSNMAPRDANATWFKLLSVRLGNGSAGKNAFEGVGPHEDEGDKVAVVTSWEWPQLFESIQTADLEAVQRKVSAGRYRENVQATDWVGYAVADVLNLDASKPGHRSKIKGLLTVWIQTKALEKYTDFDAKGNERLFVRVGPGA